MASKSKTTLVLNRNYTLVSLKGHSVTFVKDTPIHVPPTVYQEALAIGAIPPDGAAPEVEERAKAEAAPSDPAERAALILEVVKQLVLKNEREDFTAAGTPAVDSVVDALGFRVQAKEIAAVWQTYHDAKAAEE